MEPDTAIRFTDEFLKSHPFYEKPGKLYEGITHPRGLYSASELIFDSRFVLDIGLGALTIVNKWKKLPYLAIPLTNILYIKDHYNG